MSSYPENDDQFEEIRIKEVRPSGNGYEITREDGWMFYVGPETPVEPKAGMIVRLYGKGLGYLFRGQFIDGQKVFYRTEAEDREYRLAESYGANVAEWLSRWDDGKSVWSIEMGGIGPGYEQAIQITTAEIVRHMLDAKYDAEKWSEDHTWKRDRDAISTALHPTVDPLGLSAAQWGAALNLAAMLYRKGPVAVMTDDRVKDRKIQVSKRMPKLAA